jgi:signal peptidase I
VQAERSAMKHLAPTSIACDSTAFAELSTEILRSGKSLRFQARGGSMWPLVRDGDVVLVAPLDARSVRTGDLVLFRAGPGNVVIHRVIRVEVSQGRRRFTVQGDAVLLPDGVIPEAQVCGRVAAIDRGGAHLDMDRPVLRSLSWLAALRSRRNLGRGAPVRLIMRFVRRLPVLSRYLT